MKLSESSRRKKKKKQKKGSSKDYKNKKERPQSASVSVLTLSSLLPSNKGRESKNPTVFDRGQKAKFSNSGEKLFWTKKG